MLKTVSNRTSKKIILKKVYNAESNLVAAKILEATLSGKSVRTRNTIKPAGQLKKKFYSFPNIKTERTSSKYALRSNKSKISDMCETSESAYASFENSTSDLILNSTSGNDVKVYDLSENDYILEGAPNSSFRRKSTKLFPESEIPRQVAQPSFAENSFKIDNRTESHLALNETDPKVTHSLKNDYIPSCNDQMFHLSETRRNEIFSWIMACNGSSSDISDNTSTIQFDDDCESSIDFSSMKYEASTAEDIFLENYYANDVEVHTDNSTMPTPVATKSQSFINSSFDSANNQLNLNLLDVNRCSRTENKRSLPYEKRRIQWHTCPDSLESALTTEAEKLNEVKSYL